MDLHVIELEEVCSFERPEDTHDHSKRSEVEAKGRTLGDTGDRRDAIENAV